MRAIFHREFHWSSRTKNVGFSAYPSKKPQSFPKEFVEAAIERGCAEAVAPKKGDKVPTETSDQSGA